MLSRPSTILPPVDAEPGFLVPKEPIKVNTGESVNFEIGFTPTELNLTAWPVSSQELFDERNPALLSSFPVFLIWRPNDRNFPPGGSAMEADLGSTDRFSLPMNLQPGLYVLELAADGWPMEKIVIGSNGDGGLRVEPGLVSLWFFLEVAQ